MKDQLPVFDVLVDMARNAPARLEQLRTRLAQNIIDSATTQERRRRLEGLQFRVDAERRMAKTPMAATLKIAAMMSESLASLHRAMVTPFVEEAHGAMHDANENTPPAQNVVTFPKATIRYMATNKDELGAY